MRLRHLSTERLLGVTARLLAAASALTSVGVMLVVWGAWQQAGQSYGPDGAVVGEQPVRQRFVLLVLDLSFRQLGTPLLLASALVAAAAVALRRHPSQDRNGWLRWEVPGAGLLALVPLMALTLANLYLVTAPDGELAGAGDWFGPQPLTEMALVTMPALLAGLLTLAAAAVWWVQVGADPEALPDRDDADADEAEVIDAAEPDAPARSVGSDLDTTTDVGQDWSPEDFRPPTQPSPT